MNINIFFLKIQLLLVSINYIYILNNINLFYKNLKSEIYNHYNS